MYRTEKPNLMRSINNADVLDRAAYMADEYCNLLMRTPSVPANPVQLRAMLHRLMIQLSRVEAKRIALATPPDSSHPTNS